MQTLDVRAPRASAADTQTPGDPVILQPNGETTKASWSERLFALTRLSIGWVFLWAFLDKTFGLGFATESENAWLDGGSPTNGFLSFGTKGPFAEFYQGIAGATWADWLFMIGLLGIGIGLIFGVAYRIAAVSGAVMLFLMWTAALAPDNNPFMDDHIVYALVLLGLAAADNTRWSLSTWWRNIDVVRRNPVLW